MEMILDMRQQRTLTKGRKRIYRYFVGDFETTVYEGQQETEVWASAIVELGSENVKIHHSIDETFEYIRSLKCNMVVYYHNLKFDGNFWLYYLLNVKKFKQAIVKTGAEETDVEWKDPKDMLNNTFSYVISSKGQWYMIRIKVANYMIELRDSLKLLPFSVKAIGQAFGTKHKKLTMEYKGFRYAGCIITPEEQEYIANDVLVVKEALEIMFNDGYNKLTIGACCMAEYKGLIDSSLYNAMFPDLSEVQLPPDVYGADNVDKYIRRSYRGGWCYLVKGKENKRFYNGTTGDVNSLYPSVMSSQSGNRYPVGIPHFWTGDIPPEAYEHNRYFFVRLRTRFYLKENMLPFIQIKGNLFYRATEMLETSDIQYKDGSYVSHYVDLDGQLKTATVIMSLTCTDYKLFLEHYDTKDLEILDGCWFNTEIGIFDDYINHWKKIKMESKGAKRTEAKLFLNNLYGKMASNSDSSFKLAYMKEDESVGFSDVQENNKKCGYIPVGSAITSYARDFTIRAAQKNYHGVNKRGFIYADTDSIHCDLAPEEFKGITVDAKEFCCWKLESCWDTALFVRQKTYIEHVVQEDLEPVEPYYNVKCAGMPDTCKNLFIRSMRGDKGNPDKDSQRALDFLKTARTMDDFKIGLTICGKLMPKRIKGGMLLVDTDYTMR